MVKEKIAGQTILPGMDPGLRRDAQKLRSQYDGFIHTFLAIALLCLIVPFSVYAKDDYLIVPGERVGFITTNMTEEDVKAHVSPAEYRRDVLAFDEEIIQRGSVLYPGTDKEIFVIWKSDNEEIDLPDVMYAIKKSGQAYDKNVPSDVEGSNLQKKMLEIDYGEPLLTPDQLKRVWQDVWKKDVVFKNPGRIVIDKPHSPWHTKNGITIGTSLKKLEKLNGRAFAFSHMDACGSGATSWENGKLSSYLIPTLVPGIAPELVAESLFNWELRSDSQAVRSVPWKIDKLRINFP